MRPPPLLVLAWTAQKTKQSCCSAALQTCNPSKLWTGVLVHTAAQLVHSPLLAVYEAE